LHEQEIAFFEVFFGAKNGFFTAKNTAFFTRS